jgi:hypothetical protein
MRRQPLTRRDWLGLVYAPARRAFGQGISSRSVKPLPRGKPSGIPFQARFTDVAAQAGLHEPVIYGASDRKNYIVEAVGCGCAFFDYDDDGWLDIFLLSGSRLDNPVEGATNRLYHNNRDGTFTDVTDRAGLRRSGWASAVIKWITTTMARKTNSLLTGPECSLSKQRRWYHRHNQRGRTSKVPGNAVGRDVACRLRDHDGYLICLLLHYLIS